jgi:hypothetical protein
MALRAEIVRLREALNNAPAHEQGAIRKDLDRLWKEHAEATTLLQTERRELSALKATTAEARTAFGEFLDYRKRARLRVPWLPRQLVELFTQLWVEYGNATEATEALRQTAVYEKYFPGIRDPRTGALRMSEKDYLGTVMAYQDALDDFGIHNRWLRARIPDLIAGNVSAAEFKERLSAMDTRILQQQDELRRIYKQYYGLEGMTKQALLGAAIDPDLRTALLNKQISVAEIGGEALESGFRIGIEMSEQLFQAGVSRAQADQLFQGAELLLGGLSRASRRQFEGAFGLENHLGAEALGDAASTRQLQRVIAGEQSRFTEVGFGSLDQLGRQSGLVRR